MLPPLPEPLQALATAFSQAAVDRLTLFLNHVLSAEPVAMDRLRPHAGRTLEVSWQGVPAFVPAPPPVAWQVTPAGLLERLPGAAGAGVALRVLLDARDPARWWAALQAGEPPPMEIQGDAQFAADVNWLVANVRWDAEDDLARMIGDAPAHQLASLGRALVAALRRFAGPRPR